MKALFVLGSGSVYDQNIKNLSVGARTQSQARGGGEAADCGSALRWSELGPMRFVQLI